MRGKFFLDTNIFVYSFDHSAPEKRDKARSMIMDALQGNQGAVSYQVVQEFLNVALTKFESPLSSVDAKQYLVSVLIPLCQVYPDTELYSHALDIHERAKYAFYDCLIIAGAKRAGAETLYTEDLQDGQVLDGLTIVNPFR